MTENRPQYGEKAPEGWQNPLLNEQANQELHAAGQSQPASHDAETTPQQLAGVPHNLGGAHPNPAISNTVQPGAAQPGAAQPGAAPAGMVQPGSAVPPQYPAQPQYPTQPGQGYNGVIVQEAPPAPPSNARKADRIVTFVLIALGVLGTLFSVMTMFGMPFALDQMAVATGLSSSGSDAMPSVIISVILLVVIYVLTVVFSLLLIKKQKLSFWLPLLGAAVSMVVFFIMLTVATAQVIPFELLSDPAFLIRLQEWSNSVQDGYYY